MGDYIRREDTCGDCIHVDICEECEALVEFSRKNIAYCGGFLRAADVAPVVRCKDCKGINYGVSRPEGRYLCERKSLWVFNNDFCSYGERRVRE